MRGVLSRFLADESGATAVEYVVIASIISVAIIGGATALGSALGAIFQDVAGNF